MPKISAFLPPQTGPHQIDFAVDKEPMGRYTLEDGTVLTIKNVLMKVLYKGVNDKGFPQYDLGMQNVVDVEPGPQYKKTGG
jgi:hypothetical protein